jgi:hypothetical protein
MEQIIHLLGYSINMEEVDTLVAGLEAACGGNRIQVLRSFDLVVNDDRQAAALKALFSGDSHAQDQLSREIYLPKSKVKVQRKHSYRIEATGEILSRQALNKKLANHEIDLGIVVTNAEGQKFGIELNLDDPSNKYILHPA